MCEHPSQAQSGWGHFSASSSECTSAADLTFFLFSFAAFFLPSSRFSSRFSSSPYSSSSSSLCSPWCSFSSSALSSSCFLFSPQDDCGCGGGLFWVGSASTGLFPFISSTLTLARLTVTVRSSVSGSSHAPRKSSNVFFTLGSGITFQSNDPSDDLSISFRIRTISGASCTVFSC